jgi:hypothetical protein
LPDFGAVLGLGPVKLAWPGGLNLIVEGCRIVVVNQPQRLAGLQAIEQAKNLGMPLGGYWRIGVYVT